MYVVVGDMMVYNNKLIYLCDKLLIYILWGLIRGVIYINKLNFELKYFWNVILGWFCGLSFF